jgi:hypothetical protein
MRSGVKFLQPFSKCAEGGPDHEVAPQGSAYKKEELSLLGATQIANDLFQSMRSHLGRPDPVFSPRFLATPGIAQPTAGDSTGIALPGPDA